MNEYSEITIELMEKHKGEYVQFGGNGIIDGLKLAPDKLTLWRIEDFQRDGDGIIIGVFLHGYRAKRKRRNWMPIWRFNQAIRVFTKKEWQDMPICGLSTKRLWSEESKTWSCTVINPDR